MTILRLCMIGAMLLSFAGCNSDPPVTPGDSEFGKLPRITGIRVTTENAVELGTWGETNDHQGFREDFYVYHAYPNPFDRYTMLTIRNVDAEMVTVWVVRGLGPGENERDIQGPNSAVAPIASPSNPVVVWSDRQFGAGQSSFEWDGLGNDGLPVPGGFYRIYLSTAVDLFWVDVYKYDRKGDPIVPMAYDYWHY